MELEWHGRYEGITWPKGGKGWKSRYEVVGVKVKDYIRYFNMEKN